MRWRYSQLVTCLVAALLITALYVHDSLPGKPSWVGVFLLVAGWAVFLWAAYTEPLDRP